MAITNILNSLAKQGVKVTQEKNNLGNTVIKYIRNGTKFKQEYNSAGKL